MITKNCKEKFKMMFVLFMLSLAGFGFFPGSSALSAEDSLYDTAYNLTDIDKPPKVLKYSMPCYPFEAAVKGIEGRVVLRMVIDSNGIAQEPEVVTSEPEGIFEDSALDAIVGYTFKPAMKNGKNVACIVRVPIKYSLASIDREAYLTTYKKEEVDQPPETVYIAPYVYPAKALEQGISGKVVLQFIVAPDGWAFDPQVASAKPEGVFEEAALDALADYRFKPALKDGKPVTCVFQLAVIFKPDADQAAGN